MKVEEATSLDHRFITRVSSVYGEMFGITSVVTSTMHFKQWKTKVNLVIHEYKVFFMQSIPKHAETRLCF